MARRKLEEPERWITVNGAHLPVYPGGRIGSPGQKELTQKKSTKSVFGNDTDNKIKEYTDKYLKKRSDKEIQELKSNLDKSTKITGTTAQDQIAYAAIEKELESRKSSSSSTSSKNVDYNKSVDDLRQDMKDMAASGKYKTFNETVEFNESLRQLAKTNMQSSKPSTTSRNARYDTSRTSTSSTQSLSSSALLQKSESALKTMYKNASPEDQKRIAAELNMRGWYSKNGRWTRQGGGGRWGKGRWR